MQKEVAPPPPHQTYAFLYTEHIYVDWIKNSTKAKKKKSVSLQVGINSGSNRIKRLENWRGQNVCLAAFDIWGTLKVQ